MSLYYDTATILTASPREGSLKSRIYGNKFGLKSKPTHIYALISETAKYDLFLKEVVENAGLLSQEPKLTPLLSILLVHDHFFSKGGIAAPTAHPLRQSIERHKARLQAEFSKARLRRRCPTIETLRQKLILEGKGRGGINRIEPRWVRVNTLKTTLDAELNTTFKGYKASNSISEVSDAQSSDKLLYHDPNIPDLLGLPPAANLIQTESYKSGKIILQDKASCFPAYLLLGGIESSKYKVGDVIDGCAAPGNKTTHVAALISKSESLSTSRAKNSVFACERDNTRSKILQSMVQRAGAESVTVLPGQDFLALGPNESRFSQVTHLLLDPSCSGSGIIGRQDIPVLALPDDPKNQNAKSLPNGNTKSKKRKRTNDDQDEKPQDEANDDTVVSEQERIDVSDRSRLQKLSNLQSRIVEHAFSFPAATHITYSTCSVHFEENEGVVKRVLESRIAKSRGWRILKREEQIKGMREWRHRGSNEKQLETGSDSHEDAGFILDPTQLEACIRCTLGDQEGTMGFFVCGFVRDSDEERSLDDQDSEGDPDQWEGFGDE